MQRRRFLRCFTLSLIAALTLCALAHATGKVLYRFTGGADGAGPSSSLVMDASGNLYGTTYDGGSTSGSCGSGCGVVFELTRSGSDWKESVLYAFQGVPDGAHPTGNLLFDTSGNLYGTTSRGGASTNCQSEGCGTVFELSPNSGGWTETVLYNFQNSSDGVGPAGLTFDASGNLYGTTAGRSVYELSPSQQRGGAWVEHTLYSVGGGTPNPGLIFDGQGNLYGTYYDLDFQFCNPFFGCGAVFELKPGHGQWIETDLYHFLGSGNGGQPAAGVIRDSKGNLYGTGAEGGNNFGIVFELSRSGGRWKESMLYNFCSRNNCVDGAFPLAGLVMDGNGVLYGTTEWGGKCFYCGVVFKLAHTKNGWKETVLYSFQGVGGPVESVILDAQGNLYGTAGSSFVNGLVFEVTQ
jgi:uncharacterized repeat protein (TIGR03803 family)